MFGKKKNINNEAKNDGKASDSKKKSNDKNASMEGFKIIVYEDVGYSVRKIADFIAHRFVDHDKTPFLQNEQKKFLELYPQDLYEINVLNEKEIIAKIKEKEQKIKEIINLKIEDYDEKQPNISDVKFDLKKLYARQRALKFDKKASYVSFDDKGVPTFTFLRKGSSFFPFKWDTDTTSIHTAAEPVVKKAGILLRNKENKYLPKKLIETTTLILLAVAVICVIGNIFLGGWMWNKYDESNIGELERKSAEVNAACSDMVISNAQMVLDMRKEMRKDIVEDNKNKPIIKGLIPS